ncbi:MAG: carbon monoxide dehydrogenase subunit G [Woeseia sp.]
MEVKGEYLIESNRDAVWAALNDADMLQKCIPGCESLEKTGDNEFQGKVAAAIGPVRARFNTVIRLENAVPPESYTLTGESKAGAVGFGRGSANVQLVEQEGGTLLTYVAEFKVGGKLPQVGSRLVAGATKKTADDFFSCLSRELRSTQEAATTANPATAAGGDAKSSPGLSRAGIALSVAVIGLLVWWFLLR